MGQTGEDAARVALGRRRFIGGAAGVGAAAWAAPAIAGVAGAGAQTSPPPGCASEVLFVDDFDTENGGNAELNYSGFANFTVTEGSVDLIGNGQFDFFGGAEGLYVDLDGSSSNAGTLTSTEFAVDAGCLHQFRYRLAGSRRGGSDTVTVLVNGVVVNVHALASADGPTTFTAAVPAGSTSAQITFDHAGGDNVGILLLEVALEIA